MSGLKKLLGSKRAWTAIATFIVCVAVEVFSIPEATAQFIAETAVKLGLGLIGGITVSDFGMTLKGNKKE